MIGLNAADSLVRRSMSRSEGETNRRKFGIGMLLVQVNVLETLQKERKLEHIVDMFLSSTINCIMDFIINYFCIFERIVNM